MQFIRKNYPVILAWLAYAVSARLLTLLFTAGAAWLRKSLYPESSLDAYALMGLVMFIAAEYIGFSISVRWVAIPFSLIEKSLSAKPKTSSLLIDWLSFSYIFVLLCLPLLLINSFPFLKINGLPLPLPFSEDTANAISFTWKFVASVFAYRSAVTSYLNRSEKQKV